MPAGGARPALPCFDRAPTRALGHSARARGRALRRLTWLAALAWLLAASPSAAQVTLQPESPSPTAPPGPPDGSQAPIAPEQEQGAAAEGLVPPEAPAAGDARGSAGEQNEDALPPEPVPGEQPDEEDAKTPEAIHYLLERIEVVGNHRTSLRMIKHFVPIATGRSFDVNDPEIQALRYHLLGTGWYDRVELRLERGKQPGWVVLVIEVEERQTVVFQQLAMGVGWSVDGVNVNKRIGNTSGPGRKAEPYIGLALADTNFLGTGRTLGGQLLVAPDQQGIALSYLDPLLGKSRWSLRSTASFVNGQEYFGGDSGVKVSVQCDELAPKDQQSCALRPPVAVVNYKRTGIGFGTARDIGSFTRFSLDWHGDVVRVPPGGMPAAAAELRGTGPGARAPIDFAIEPGWSFVSMLTVGFTYDKRDSASLPSRGLLASFTGDLASSLLGSDYEFVRLQSSVNRWSQTRWGHTIRLGAFAGAVFGDAPFFYKFFVADLTDLMPSRILGLNLDHRPAPNLFGVFQCGHAFQAGCGTAISVMRQENLAARIDAEYVWPVVRGRKKFLRSADAFALIGLYALADQRDLRLAIPGFHGIARLPIDLTFDLGVRLDTQAGVFQIGLARLIWLPVGANK
jgi:hypothetical protein